jgi:hypothetical protein
MPGHAAASRFSEYTGTPPRSSAEPVCPDHSAEVALILRATLESGAVTEWEDYQRGV